METRTIKIEGMHRDGCVSRIEQVLGKEPGVREVDVSYRTGEARVKCNEHTVGAERFRELLESAGYAVGDAA